MVLCPLCDNSIGFGSTQHFSQVTIPKVQISRCHYLRAEPSPNHLKITSESSPGRVLNNFSPFSQIGGKITSCVCGLCTWHLYLNCTALIRGTEQLLFSVWGRVAGKFRSKKCAHVHSTHDNAASVSYFGRVCVTYIQDVYQWHGQDNACT